MSKGGSTSAQTEIPAWATEYAQRQLLDPAAMAARLGYMPYYGPDVAAMTPLQEAAMQSNIGAAEAYGLIAPGSVTPAQGMPAPRTFAGGVRGYSSGSLFDQARAMLAQRAPGQMAAYQSMYVDPMTGAPAFPGQGITAAGEVSTDYVEYLRRLGIPEELLPAASQKTPEDERRKFDPTLGGRITGD